MSVGEVYPNAPLVSVAFELRHPVTRALTPSEIDVIAAGLGETFPLRSSQHAFNQTIEFTPNGPITRSDDVETPRFLNRSKTTAVTYAPHAIAIESTAYQGWDAFRPLIALACRARAESTSIAGVERIGLRYVDEVRVPGGEAPDWTQWIDGSLLAPSTFPAAGLPMKLWQGALMFGGEPGHAMVLRYGTGNGYATDPNGELRREQTAAPGPFFLLDVDSYWSALEVPPFDVDNVLDRVDELHEPVRIAWESAITERYRAEVLRG